MFIQFHQFSPPKHTLFVLFDSDTRVRGGPSGACRERGERGARLLEERLSIRPPTATPDGMVDIILSPSGKQRAYQGPDAAV